MEASADFYRWLHAEMHYDFDTIPRRTWGELNTLQLGYVVEQEQRAEAERAAMNGESAETVRRKQGRKERARQHFAESRELATN